MADPKTIGQLVAWCQGRAASNNFAVIGVDGLPGNGKSGLSMQIARRIWPAFDPEKHMAFRAKEVITIARKLPPGGVLIVDEAIVAGGNKRRAMSGANIENMEFLNTTRKRRIIVFYVAPFYGNMDKAIREHMHWLLRVTGRGNGIAYTCEKIGMLEPSTFLDDKFPFDFPNCEVVDPDLWASYQRANGKYMGGGESDVLLRELIEQYRGIIRKHLPERLRLPPGRT